MSAVLGFLGFAILARLLEPKYFGEWMVFTTACTFVDMARSGFLQTVLIKYISGYTLKQVSSVVGSMWTLACIFTLLASGILILAYMVAIVFFPSWQGADELLWIIAFHIITLPFGVATWLLQAKMDFMKILIIRVSNLGIFVSLLLLGWWQHYGIGFVLFAYMMAHLVPSLISLAGKWTGLEHFTNVSWNKIWLMVKFGKYNMGTMIAANLVRSSDTFIIGAFLGPVAVALYNVPLKFIDVFDVPLRSIVAASQPKMAQYMNQKNPSAVRALFQRNLLAINIVIIPILLICFTFSTELVTLLGGTQYGSSSILLKIFVVYVACMPLDRFCGITLDILNKPHLNFIKVIVMLSINILGDLAVIYQWGTIESVAFVSIGTYFSGVLFGWWYIHKNLKISTFALFNFFILFRKNPQIVNGAAI